METKSKLSWFLRRRKSVPVVADTVASNTNVVETYVNVSTGCNYDEAEEVDSDDAVTDDAVTDAVVKQIYGTESDQRLSVTESDQQISGNNEGSNEDQHDEGHDEDAIVESNVECNLHDLIECLFAPDFDFNDKHMHCLNIIHDMLIGSVILLVAPIFVLEVYFRLITTDIVSHTYIESCYNLLSLFVVVGFVTGVVYGVKNIRMRRNL